MILVVGATGLVGSEICGLLAARGKQVRALVRATADPAKVDRLTALGAEIVTGDLRDPASLKNACRGMSAIVTTATALPLGYEPGINTPQTTDQNGYLSLITAARETGVQRFVYTSFPPITAAFPLQDAKRATEASLRSSGLTYTILRPTYFSEVWLSPTVGFDYPNRKATIYGDGRKAISWISYGDVAQFAVAALGNPAALDATLELGGPEALSPLEVVSIFERVGGKPFEVTHVPVEVLQAQLAAATDPMQQSFSAFMLDYANGKAIDMRETLKAFPIRLTSVEEYVRRVCPAA
ncbi:MAG: SDR family oxidoreductase [Anaerolineae bacterium]|nr:SDR family oxidoreductase [Anaerolineae bacterium]